MRVINPTPKQLNAQLFSTHSRIKAGACPSFFFKRFAADGRGHHAKACSRYQPGMKVFSCRVNKSSQLIMALLCAAPLTLAACQSHEHPGEGAAGTGSSSEHPGSGEAGGQDHQAGVTSPQGSEHPGD